MTYYLGCGLIVFVILTPTRGNDSNQLTFLEWVETTHCTLKDTGLEEWIHLFLLISGCGAKKTRTET